MKAKLVLLITTMQLLSGCIAIPMVAAVGLQVAAKKGAESGYKDAAPESIAVYEESGIIRVTTRMSEGFYSAVRKKLKDHSEWSVASALIKAEELGCVKIKSLNQLSGGEAKIEKSGLLKNVYAKTSAYKCVLDADQEGQEVGDLKVLYTEKIAQINELGLINKKLESAATE